jgi:hypothetical protein
MDEIEARSILGQELSHYRAFSYSELLALVDTANTIEHTAPSGTKYQIEMQVLFDDQQRKTLRILGAVDDFSLRKTISPLCDSFIMAPDGSFLGE